MFSELEDAVMLQENRYLNEEELFKLNDHTQMLVECSLNGKSCELEIFFNYKYFNCYRFKTDQVTEKKFVLKAVVYTGKPLRISQQRGFYLFIESDKSYPLLSTPIFLSTRSGRHIEVKKNSYIQYPAPYSDCQVLENNELIEDLLDRSIFDMVLATNYSYSRDICLTICKQQLNKEVCGCQLYGNYLLNGTELCRLDIMFENFCTFQGDANSFCMPRCPLECSRSDYRKQINAYTYQSSYFEKYEHNLNLTNDLSTNDDGTFNIIPYTKMATFMYDTFVEFSIGYDSSLDAEYIEDPKMTGEELLGILGGHFHLFLGMSLLSFFEIVELLIVIFF